MNNGAPYLRATGQEHLQRIAVVKKDKGLRIDRRKEYKYQDLASKFIHIESGSLFSYGRSFKK
ncbi:hypothetical protein ATZ36_08890 [Candidatus Endomicrobiellum trichonymphae]|uniref:Uncharacterized protein n=1 Tax=Endomicrobium trichonymphae TaxID=1408204 RepID=A0A1E5IGI1_ENDTX|nr:hypothetical protein ATZ36_08890 [Candidatus Endomicrobium trichonymphae]